MANTVSDFDLGVFDSGTIDLATPQFFSSKLLAATAINGAERNRVDDTRLRLVSNLVVASNLMDGECRLLLQYPVESLLMGQVPAGVSARRTTSAGLDTLHVDGWLSILVPKLEAPNHAELLINDLNELSDRYGGVVNWAVDFSSAEQLTPSLVGYLLGFNHSLKDYSKRMLLLWLRADAVPDALLPPLAKAFQLHKRGVFLVSRAANRTPE